ncbi:TolC family protein [Fibrella sp. HMF5335]|uniref:TolC family protein n=1 Tax=Fibrella rubiginis TaxID=2817060 RepID=A0A939GJR9_9BACT|nr:TolC family protein [Fibrella rubiginis]MBO0938046.1 TolC family protein [Fibrella rubiginis]
MRLCFAVFLCICTTAAAQDTLSVTLPQADSLFIRRNLLALAGRFQIEAAQAQIVQARLFDNPTAYLELNAFNPAAGQVLDVGGTGQKALAIQQTILLAGKRSKRVAVATQQSRLTELQFADLLRTLRFDLHSRFYSIYFTSNTLAVYRQQRTRLTETIAAFARQYEKNNVALRELVRLKALLLQLNNDQLELQNRLTEQQRDLRILLQTSATIQPIIRPADTTRFARSLPTLTDAVSLALENRPDLKGAEVAVRQADANAAFQKALATPDLRVGGMFDQNASYTPNYLGITLSMDLPILNRNQGNIQSARAQGSYLRLAQRQVLTVVENEIRAALEEIQQTEVAYRSIDQSFPAQFDQLNQSILRNFERGNVSLIEFVDLFETYLQNVQQLNRLSADRITAYEQLTFTIGTDLFR